MLSNIWQFLTNIETLFSFLAMIFAGYASFRLWKQKRQYKELAKTAPKLLNFQDNIKNSEGIQTLNPIALAVSLVANSPNIRKDVEHFLSSKGLKMDIDELNMNGINNSDDLERFINSLKEKRHFFDLQGNTEIHLFIQGPVTAGILTGAMFDNWKPVKLYQKPIAPIPTIYEYWCPITK